jgi:hypothetical protein
MNGTLSVQPRRSTTAATDNGTNCTAGIAAFAAPAPHQPQGVHRLAQQLSHAHGREVIVPTAGHQIAAALPAKVAFASTTDDDDPVSGGRSSNHTHGLVVSEWGGKAREAEDPTSPEMAATSVEDGEGGDTSGTDTASGNAKPIVLAGPAAKAKSYVSSWLFNSVSASLLLVLILFACCSQQTVMPLSCLYVLQSLPQERISLWLDEAAANSGVPDVFKSAWASPRVEPGDSQPVNRNSPRVQRGLAKPQASPNGSGKPGWDGYDQGGNKDEDGSGSSPGGSEVMDVDVPDDAQAQEEAMDETDYRRGQRLKKLYAIISGPVVSLS